jgi:hypothetical protein
LICLPLVVAVHGLLHRDSAANRVHSTGEDDHQAVAEILDLLASVHAHGVAQQPEVGASELLSSVVT